MHLQIFLNLFIYFLCVCICVFEGVFVLFVFVQSCFAVPDE